MHLELEAIVLRGRGEKVRKALAIGMALALVSMMFVVLPMKASAAHVDSITPSRGMVGKPAIIHGSELKAGPVVVLFGSVPADEVHVLNDKTLKVTIPQKDARDPDPLPVKVDVDGQPAGELLFSYKILGPAPVITDLDPSSVPASIEFSEGIMGTDFTTPQGRKPYQLFLVSVTGVEIIEGWVIPVSITETRFMAKFPAATPDKYSILVGFTDGSGANVEGFEVT